MFLQLLRKPHPFVAKRFFPVNFHCSELKSSLNLCTLTQKTNDSWFVYNSKVNFCSSSALCKDISLIEKLKQEVTFEKVKQELSVFRTVDLKELKCAPFPALLYGFGGIIPFVLPSLYLLTNSYCPFVATSQLFYGATILAFVGGVKWGNALAKGDISHEQIGASTIPSLVAWSALLFPEPIGFLVISSGLVGALYLDLKSSKYPPWFYAIRFSLTSIAVTSLIVSFFCNLLN